VCRDINRRIVPQLDPQAPAHFAAPTGARFRDATQHHILIVDQLIQENWVLTGPTVRLPRGRRPTRLRLNDERVMIGVDIRPAADHGRVADANGRFVSQEAIVTTPDRSSPLGRLVEVIQRIVASCRGRKIEGIGVSVPGPLHPWVEPALVRAESRWRDVDIRTPLMKATGLEVEIENAATACAFSGRVVRPHGTGSQPGGGHGFRGRRHGNPAQWPESFEV